MSDLFTQSTGLQSLLPATLAQSAGQANGLGGSAAATFALMLAKALLQVAVELQTPGGSASSLAGLASGAQGSALGSLASLTSMASGISNTAGAATTYAPGVATRAYQTSSGWNFVPTTIVDGQTAAATTAAADPALSSLAAGGAKTTAVSAAPAAAAPAAAATAASAAPSTGPWPLSAFPHPAGDNGRGMHWVPTVSSTTDVVDRFVDQMSQMKVKWAVILNDGSDMTQNDYLVNKLEANGIEPVMRVFTPGMQPVSGDLGAMVRHYTAMGVHYFQLYNEPNHPVETGGAAPDVNKYLDLWLPAAKVVADNGGLPGLGALSPGGDTPDSPGRMDDRAFLRQALQGIKDRGAVNVLDKAWLAAHNYMGDRPLSDPDGLQRVSQYDQIVNETLGRSMPIIGTEGGSFASSPAGEAAQTTQVTDAMRYMRDERAPYNFAYTYWVIANSLGGGHDQSFEWQALFQPGHTSPLVDALKNQ